jgi:hypothetical protein
VQDVWMTSRAAILVEPTPGWAKTLVESLRPGAHAFVITAEVGSIEGRIAGFEVRDTLLVLSAGPKSRYAFLFRKPTEETTILSQVVETGDGALNVAGCRIGWGSENQEEWSKKGSAGSGSPNIGQNTEGMHKAYAEGAVSVPTGRWPTNVLLIHAPTCRSLNSLAAWQCDEGCPVKMLDEISGQRPSTLTGRADPRQIHENPGDNRGMSLFGGGNSNVYADHGGASRFYPQFANDDEMIDWMKRLVEVEP